MRKARKNSLVLAHLDSDGSLKFCVPKTGREVEVPLNTRLGLCYYTNDPELKFDPDKYWCVIAKVGKKLITFTGPETIQCDWEEPHWRPFDPSEFANQVFKVMEFHYF